MEKSKTHCYLDTDGKPVAGIQYPKSLISHLRAFVRSTAQFSKNPLDDGFAGLYRFPNKSVINKEEAQAIIIAMVDMAITRKGGDCLTDKQMQKLRDFRYDARIIDEYFTYRTHRSGRNQLRTNRMRVLYPEINSPSDYQHYAVRVGTK